MFAITPIGSCRITTPLKRGQEKFGFHLNMDRCYGYCHSPAEAVQMARFMLGEISIPADVWPLVSRSHTLSAAEATFHSLSNLYVVELASAKEVTVDGVSVQLNYLNSAFSAFFADKTRAQVFWDLAENGSDDKKAQFLAAEWSATPEQIADAQMLQRLKMKRVTQESLERDLLVLKQLLPNLLVVSHVNACKPDGRAIASRSQFIDMVFEATNAVQVPFDNPTQLMDVYGQAFAIEDESTGLAHFTDEFGAALMQHWVRTFVAPLDSGVGIIEKSTTEAFDQAVSDALGGAFDEFTNSSLLMQAGDLGAFDQAQKLAEQRTVSMPKFLAMPLAKQAADQGNFEAALAFAAPFLQQNDTAAVRLSVIIWHKMRGLSIDMNADLDAIIESWSATTADCAELNQRISDLDMILRIKPKHGPTRRAMQAARKELVTIIREAGANRDLATLDGLAPFVDSLQTTVADLSLWRARVNFQLGFDEAALKIGQQAVAELPDNINLWVLLMRAAKRSSEQEKSIQKEKNVVRLAKPENENLRIEAQTVLDGSSIGA